jgi:mannose-6-phosphate isomerase-like protein (cupin superfamily)
MLSSRLNWRSEDMTINTKRFVVPPGEEPIWTMAPGRTAALKLQNAQTGQSVMAFEEVSPAGATTPFHLHRDSDEVMYVLSGHYSFKIGDDVTSGGPGTCVFMPRGVPHAWKNTGAETGRAFFMYTPGEAGKLFEELTQLQSPFSTDDPEIEQVLHRCGWEILAPSPF